MAKEKTYDDAYEILLNGFFVSLAPNPGRPNYYTVTLEENGAKVYITDIPNVSQDDGEIEEKVLNDIAKAAIDMFEAERGTLGLGAGAKSKKGKKGGKMKKHAYLINCRFDNWYMNFKGTAYEQQAYDMLSKYIDMNYNLSSDTKLNDINKRLGEIEYQLSKLDLERMRKLPMATQIIIVKAAGLKKRSYYGEVESIKEYLDRFAGNPMESQAIKLMKQYIELLEEQEIISKEMNAKYNDLYAFEAQMEDLSMGAMYSNVLNRIPTEGLEAFPNMAGDIAELMQGVEMDTPLVPTSMGSVLAKTADKALNQATYSFSVKLANWFEDEIKKVMPDVSDDEWLTYWEDVVAPYFVRIVEASPSVSASKRSKRLKKGLKLDDIDTQGLDFVVKNFMDSIKDNSSYSSVKAIVADLTVELVRFFANLYQESSSFELTGKKKRSFEEVEPVEDRINELGEYHEGLDIAEAEYPDNKQFEIGDSVSLSKKVEVPCAMGLKEMPKGTKGIVESLFDAGNLVYNVMLFDEDDKGVSAKVPASSLTKSK